MYITPHEILSRNALFNMMIGARGGGKTFGAMKHVINRYLKYGEKTFYLRRYKTELTKKDKLLDDMARIAYPDLIFGVDGTEAYLKRNEESEKEYFMTFGALSSMSQGKSIPYPDIFWLLFEEFIIPKGKSLHYIKNEVEDFLDIYNTIDRYRGQVRAIMLANAIDIANPYFIFFGIMPDQNKEFYKYKNGELILQMCKQIEYKKYAANTRFGKFISGTPYGDYSTENYFRNDDNTFIEEKSAKAQARYAVKYRDLYFSVWLDFNTNIYYITKKQVPDKICFALTKDGHNYDTVMLEKADTMMKNLKRIYQYGYVRFQDVQVKQYFYDLLKYLGM